MNSSVSPKDNTVYNTDVNMITRTLILVQLTELIQISSALHARVCMCACVSLYALLSMCRLT